MSRKSQILLLFKFFFGGVVQCGERKQDRANQFRTVRHLGIYQLFNSTHTPLESVDSPSRMSCHPTEKYETQNREGILVKSAP